MGKRLIQQKRGKGSSTYRAKSFNYFGAVKYSSFSEEEVNGAISGKVRDLVHCAGHYAPLMVVQYSDDKYSLLIAPEGIRVGQEVMSGTTAKPEVGNVITLGNIPEGTEVFNIESRPGDGGKFARSSGSTARILSKVKDKIVVQLPSKRTKSFHINCRATIGSIAGYGRTEKPLMKAGNNHHKKRARNKLYPRMRGVAMNSVDHPYGSGRGSHKGKPTIARRHAPPGAKVGKIRPRRTGKK